MKRGPSSLDSPFPLNNPNMQVAWGLVIYGTNGEHIGVEPEITGRIMLCCKDLFNHRHDKSEAYWQRQLSYRKVRDYRFKVISSWREEFINVVGKILLAKRNLKVSEKVHIENLGKYCDNTSNFRSSEELFEFLKPYAKVIITEGMDARAQYHLATGHLGRQEFQVGVHLMELAAKTNHAGALYALACHYRNSLVNRDFNRSNDCFNKLQEHGIIHKKEEISLDEVRRSQSEYIQKMINWCFMVYHHSDVSKHCMIYDAIYPFEEYLQFTHIHADAQFLLGYCYLNGHGIEKDFDEADKYLKLSAGQDHPLALTALADFYLSEESNIQDPDLAFEYMKRAADLEDPIAQGKLSDFYLHGTGTNKNIEQAVNYALKSAFQGDPTGLYRAGCLYYRGLGVKKDKNQAFEYFKEAADLGHAEAQNNMSLFYRSGIVTENDIAKAFLYAKLAADQGILAARAYVHKCYTEGLGTKADSEMALNYAGSSDSCS